MYRPYHGNVILGQKVEQYLIIQEITVNIVDMYHVRLYLLDLIHQLLSGYLRHQPVCIEKAGDDSMQSHIPLVPYRYLL